MKILHISVPKNGGTFIANHLACNFKPDQCFIVDLHNVSLDSFLKDADRITEEFSLVAGHIPFRFVAPFAKRFDMIVSSYRDPWSRAWSAFKYITHQDPKWNHLRPRSAEDTAENFSRFIEDYFVSNRFTRNNQCGYLGEDNRPESALMNIAQYRIRMLWCGSLKEDIEKLFFAEKLRLKQNAPKNEADDAPVVVRRGQYPLIDDRIDYWFAGDSALCATLRGC
ncbi:MAG TPA: hypothetical protein VHY35_02405 [Stellaceae bacterium]|jgi:hypothetical protein|nr:hypothetical protein [Stellaceae bacterium]